MTPVIFHIEKHLISYQVNWIGIETVKVNNVQVSKKLSLPKRKHSFNLEVYGKNETFYIKSKQLFSSGYITVQLFHNDICIDEKSLEFKFYVNNEDVKKPQDSTFITGVIFIVFSLIFGWSKFFLFFGLIFLLSSILGNQSGSINSDESNDRETNN